MHAAVIDYLAVVCEDMGDGLLVFEVGGKDINGQARSAIAPARVSQWWSCDLVAGQGVDAVVSGTVAEPPFSAALAVCCEVFEHTDEWRAILANMTLRTRPGGCLVVTMAGPGRAPHSAVDGGPLRHGEHYANILPEELRDAMMGVGLQVLEIQAHRGRGDVYGLARVPDRERHSA